VVSERGADEAVREGGRLRDTAVSELDEDPGGISVFSVSPAILPADVEGYDTCCLVDNQVGQRDAISP
jgi:hypothetical protein